MNVREAFSRIAANVCVATVGSPGHAHGVTLTSAISLSLEPPLLGFALFRDSRMLRALTPGVRLGLAVLDEGQEDIAMQCGGRDRGPIDEAKLYRDASGTPVVAGGAAAFRAAVLQRLPAGDHVFVVARIEEACTGRAPPLLYFARRYGHMRLPPPDASTCTCRTS